MTQMNSNPYPQNRDFLNAIKRPQNCFQDEELKQCQPERRRGRPISWSGRFAIVFKLESAKTSWGVRCFTEPPEDDIRIRYDTISQYLHSNPVKSIVKFEFIESGILVNNSWYPIVKMEWVEGETLDTYLDEKLKINRMRQFTLVNLLNGIEGMQKELKAAKIAHGDLQHDNILVTPDGKLKLVDYDEMYVPGLEKYAPKREKGHPNYQNQKRAYKDWGERIDDFSFNVILLSINALFHQPSLWEDYHRKNDNLIFSKEDFIDPDTSKIFQVLPNINNEKVQRLTKQLQQECYPIFPSDWKAECKQLKRRSNFNNFNEALEFCYDLLNKKYSQPIPNQEKNKINLEIAQIHLDIVKLYHKYADYNRARDHALQTILNGNLFSVPNINSIYSQTHYELGLISEEQKQWQKALQAFSESLKYQKNYHTEEKIKKVRKRILLKQILQISSGFVGLIILSFVVAVIINILSN